MHHCSDHRSRSRSCTGCVTARSHPCSLAAWCTALGTLALALCTTGCLAQAPNLSLDDLPRHAIPPPERGPVVPAQVERWRVEAKALEHGDGMSKDPERAATLYCRAARYGDAESQFSLAWMLTNSRGIARDEAQAAHLFAAAAEQGMVQAQNILARMGTPQGDVPACLRQPEAEQPKPKPPPPAKPGMKLAPPPLPPNANPVIVNFVNLIAPEYKLEPYLVLAIIAAESNFDPRAVSPKRAQGLMQLIPETAARFGVRNAMDPAQNIRGGMAYLRWLLAYFEGDITLVAAAYNAGEGAVERYKGVPPYAETRHYVRRIHTLVGLRTLHPFDASVVAPSHLANLIRAQIAPR